MPPSAHATASWGNVMWYTGHTVILTVGESPPPIAPRMSTVSTWVRWVQLCLEVGRYAVFEATVHTSPRCPPLKKKTALLPQGEKTPCWWA
jgi:hypothetical protein